MADLRPVDPPHTEICASDDCPCFAEGKQSLRHAMGEIRDEVVGAMERAVALFRIEDGKR